MSRIASSNSRKQNLDTGVNSAARCSALFVQLRKNGFEWFCFSLRDCCAARREAASSREAGEPEFGKSTLGLEVSARTSS